MRATAVRTIALAAIVAMPGAAAAHHPSDGLFAPFRNGAYFEPWLLGCLALSAVLYAAGVASLWQKAGIGRGIRPWQCAGFAAAWLTLALALVSPLDALAATRFWIHMVQHELLMVVAAPLFVVSRPLEAMTWALPRRWRAATGRALHRRWLVGTWRAVRLPSTAWLLHAIVLWGWHAPLLFEAALKREGVHIVQHVTFLASALLFWWTVLRPHGRIAHGPDATSLASLFTTMLHTGALGALLTFSGAVWYPSYRIAIAGTGLTALEDQQLGGLVMWVPAGFVYVVVALVIAATWLGENRRAPALSVASYRERAGQPIGRVPLRR